MYIRKYVRTYTCMYVHMYVYMYVGMYARTYIFMYSQLCGPVYVRIYAVSMSVFQSVYLLRNAGFRITLAADLNYKRCFGITVIYFVYIRIQSVVFLSLHGQITVILISTLDNECHYSKVISIQGKTKPLSIQDSILLRSFL
jgi:hypothetical protein